MTDPAERESLPHSDLPIGVLDSRCVVDAFCSGVRRAFATLRRTSFVFGDGDSAVWQRSAGRVDVVEVSPGACLTQFGAAGNDASFVERPRSTQRGNRRRYSERLRLVRWLVCVLLVGVTACGAPSASPTTNASVLTSVDLATSASTTIPATEPGGGTPSSSPVTTPQVAVAAIVAPSVEDTIAVDAVPTAMATGSGRLWIASTGDIVAIDPASGTTSARVAVPGIVAMTLDTNFATSSADPPRLAACSADQTVEIGTVSGAISASYPYGCTGIAAGAGGLWIVSDDKLVELGPQGDLLGTFDVDHGLGVAATSESVWVIEAGSGHAQLREIDHYTGATVTTYALDGTAEAVVADDAGVWVSERSGDGVSTLVGFGTAGNSLPRRYLSGSGGTGLDFSGQFLWAASANGVSVVDTSSGELVGSWMLSASSPAASAVRLVAADGRVFISGRVAEGVQRVHPGTFGDSMRSQDAPVPTRIEVGSGCPTSIANTASAEPTPFVNPDPTGLADTFVPGQPTAAIICRYGDVKRTLSALGSTTYVGGALRRHARLDAEEAVKLANTFNDAVPAPYTSSCTIDPDGPAYTAVAFSIPGRRDVDVWYKDHPSCPSVSNGVRDAELINPYRADIVNLLDKDLASN